MSRGSNLRGFEATIILIASVNMDKVRNRLKQRANQSRLLRKLPLQQHAYRLDRPEAIFATDLGIAFIPTPKVANRSIKAAVMTKEFPKYNGDPHKPGWDYRPTKQLSKFGGFSFAFVRDPFDRLYSAYTQKIVHYARQQGTTIFWRYGELFYPSMTFEAFVNAVSSTPDAISDRHFRSQHTMLFRDDALLVDFVGRFERLDEDWQEVQSHADLPNLPHWNQSKRGPYEVAYTPRMLNLTAERYKKDLELFDY